MAARISPRIVVAMLVVVVGGSLWAILPENPGSLHDASGGVRATVPPGRALAAWVLVRNTGPDRITLRSASVDAPPGVKLLGTAARRGFFPAVDDTWPSPREAFRPLRGFVVEPRTKATIAFGLEVDGERRVRLAGVTVSYRQDGATHELRVAKPAVLRFRAP